MTRKSGKLWWLMPLALLLLVACASPTEPSVQTVSSHCELTSHHDQLVDRCYP